MLELVKLAGFEDRRPAQLSGGQKQRVALARALINQPKVLLLDEPLGALDLKLREEMQIELRNLQRRLGITFIYVTHDQGEALSMSDRVAVFNHGRIEQMAQRAGPLCAAAHAFVARFVGGANVAEGDVAQKLSGAASRSRSARRMCSVLAPADAVAGRYGDCGRMRCSTCSTTAPRAAGRCSSMAARFSRRRATPPTSSHVPGAPGERVRSPGSATTWSRWTDALSAVSTPRPQRFLRPRGGPIRGVSTFLYRRSTFYLLLLLVPPLLWLGTVYLGTLFALLMQSFYSIDEFTAQIVRKPTLATYRQLFTQPANLDIVFRTLTMAVCVTIAAAIIAFPDRELHGALRVAAREGAVLRRRAACRCGRAIS